jgi:hypothetical protein
MQGKPYVKQIIFQLNYKTTMVNTKLTSKLLQLTVIAMTGLIALRCGPEMSDVSVSSNAAQATAAQTQDKKGLDNPAAQNKVNAEIRQATAHYQQVERALADGYRPSGHCVPNMGIHYVNGSLVDGIVDHTKPEILVYEPQKNGRMRLVAVEYIVVAAPWDAAHAGPPMLGSQPYDDHRPAGSPGPPFPHYQLHVWVWKHNPNGMYATLNPTVSCDFQ